MAVSTEKFLDTFVATGDYLVSMKEAGYKDKNPYQLQVKGKKLVEENREEVDKRFQARLKEGGPRALSVIEQLMHSESDTVKLNAAKEILDRGGHKVVNEFDTGRTIEELNAQLIALVGEDGAKMLVGAFRSRKVISGPELTEGNG
tara:strand:- start:9282 stop:9719 length:438 start_codon:yes stop_codon:yes gene_type:complete